MKTEDFAKLPYGQQLDVCVPYLKGRAQKSFEQWKRDIIHAYGDGMHVPVGELAGIDDADADGQSIVNFYYTVVESAHMEKDVNVGMNLEICINPPNTGIPEAGVVATDNNLPYQGVPALSETRRLEGGMFAGVPAEGKPSKIVELQFSSMLPPYQYQFSIVSGYADPNNKMWALTRAIPQGDPDWVEDLGAW